MYDLQTTHPDASELAGALVISAKNAARSGRRADAGSLSTSAPETNTNPVAPTPGFDNDGDAWDDVYGASMDSFPASDPPPWMSMRIGGPPRPPAAETNVPQSAVNEASTIRARVGRPFDDEWVARSWSDVRIARAEASPNGQYWNAGHPVLRAVVHLGALTPADVRVWARYRMAKEQTASGEPLRLWSVATLNDEEVVFESGMLGEALEDVSELTVIVEPANAHSNGSALTRVSRSVVTRAG